MNLTLHRFPKTGRADRRRDRRYPIDVELEYKLLQRGHAVAAGRGRTINASSHAILFEAQHRLPPGREIELTLAWPARLDQEIPLKLCVTGLTVRAEGACTAVRIERYTFRTAGVSDAAKNASAS